ncbi:MAG: transglutaminase domain-containing protein [archaeon]
MNVIETGTKPNLESIIVNISFIPLVSEYQIGKIISTAITPAGQITEGAGSLVINWENPRHEQEFSYLIKTEITTQNTLKKVLNTQRFPISNLDKNYISLTEPTEFIDTNEDITNKAVEIIAGETDLYKVMFKLADWVKTNINYELTTLTADAVQKSSWVLENKRGVCDEITNLYISLLRSVGIPAKFVAGQAYSNIGDSFGNHGWAEAYYPGKGWIPFDVTYGQFGWVDPTHVKFKEAADSGAASVDYSWKARDIDLIFDDLKVDTRIQEEHKDLETYAKISVEPMKYKVGPGSYVPVQVIAENPNDYYVPLKIIVKKAPKLLETESTKEVLLGPHESTSVFWTVIIPEEVDPNSVYSTIVEVYSPFAGTAESTIKFAENYETVSKMWAEDITASLSEREDKSFFPNLDWKCSLNKETYYQEEIAILTCNAKNIGNTVLQNIKFCFEEDCKTKTLEKGVEEQTTWNLPLTNEETRKTIATAESESLIRYSYPNLKIIQDPKVELINLNQKPIPYNSEGEMTFTIKSEHYAKNIKLLINKVIQYDLSELEGDHSVITTYQGRFFYTGKMTVQIIYEDELGKQYLTNKVFDVIITEIPWYIQLVNWINNLLGIEIQI